MSTEYPHSIPAIPSPQTDGPLTGIVVADFSRVLAGPYATMLLADLGATVIKVESPDGDDSRTWMPPALGDQASYYQAVNRNKHSIVLDLADSADLKVAKQIAARGDVFIHNFKPGSIDRFGLDYEGVKALRPNVIYSHITGFGTQPGGYGLPGYDVLIQGFSGFMDMCGDPAGSPTRSGVSLFDLATGMLTAYGVLGALRHRDLTGEGQLVENNLMSTSAFMMANQYQAVGTTDVVPTRAGDEHQTLYPYNAFPTSDGQLIVVAVNNSQFARFCKVLGIEELVSDERFDNSEKRNLNRRELAPYIESALRTGTKQEWFERLRAAGLPCAPVQNVSEGLQFASDVGLGPLWQTADANSVPTVRNSVQMSVSPPTYRKEPPRLGEDSHSVRAWLNGEVEL